MSANLPNIKPTSVLRLIRGSPKALQKAKKVDPSERYVLLYPNSESAYVGMGFNLLNTQPSEEIFIRANKILDQDLLKLCLDGPKAELLGSLENRNLATYVTSHATIAKLQHNQPHVIPFCKAAGGVGVGFVNSLVFSGALTFEDGLDLVKRQAQAMDRAAKVIPSAKISVHLMPATPKMRVCQAAIEHCLKLGIPREIAVCSVAKQSYAHRVEFAGHEEAIKYLENEGQHLFEFRRVKRLTKSPEAYHTELMRPAAQFVEFYIKQKLAENQDYIKEPTNCSVYSATKGERVRYLNSIKKDLSDFPVKPLKIEQLLHCLFSRPKDLSQPNVFVVWDKNLLKTLSSVNRRAWNKAKLLEA